MLIAREGSQLRLQPLLPLLQFLEERLRLRKLAPRAARVLLDADGRHERPEEAAHLVARIPRRYGVAVSNEAKRVHEGRPLRLRARLRERAPLRAVPEPQRHLQRHLAPGGIHLEDAGLDRGVVFRERARVLAVGIEDDEAGVGSARAGLLRPFEAPTDQAGDGAGLAATGVTEDGQMAPDQAVRIDAHPSVPSQRARADLGPPPFAGLHNRAELRIGGQHDGGAHRRQRVGAAVEDVVSVVRSSSQGAQRVDAQPAQWIRQVHEAEVLHPAPLRKGRSFDRDPLGLADEESVVDRDQQVAVDTGERPRSSRIQRDGLGRLDIEGDLDLVRRDEVDRADPEASGLLEGSLAHPSEPPSFGGGVGSLSPSPRPAAHRAFSSSAMRKVVRSIAGFGR